MGDDQYDLALPSSRAPRYLASIRVLEKAGFRRTGERRAEASTGGEVVDELLYALGKDR
jgi:RimJ/RimL family protein N-acetyltransferase